MPGGTFTLAASATVRSPFTRFSSFLITLEYIISGLNPPCQGRAAPRRGCWFRWRMRANGSANGLHQRCSESLITCHTRVPWGRKAQSAFEKIDLCHGQLTFLGYWTRAGHVAWTVRHYLERSSILYPPSPLFFCPKRTLKGGLWAV